MAQDFLSDFIERAQARDSRLGRALKSRTAGVLERCVDGFQRDNDLLWASALTYTTGLSIVPILAVALSALNGLGGAEVIRPLLERYLTANSPQITDRLMSFVSNVNAKTLGAVGAATLLFTVVLTLGTVEQALNNIFRVVYGRTMARKFADYLSLHRGEKVKISGFGSFTVNHKRARRGRNPQTGITITIDSRRVLSFKPSQVLKGLVANGAKRRA